MADDIEGYGGGDDNCVGDDDDNCDGDGDDEDDDANENTELFTL